MKDDAYYIKLCEILAGAAATKGESPVGSVIIKNNEIVSEAMEASKEKNDVTCHAELEAIRLAVKNLRTMTSLIALSIQLMNHVLCAPMQSGFIKSGK